MSIVNSLIEVAAAPSEFSSFLFSFFQSCWDSDARMVDSYNVRNVFISKGAGISAVVV